MIRCVELVEYVHEWSNRVYLIPYLISEYFLVPVRGEGERQTCQEDMKHEWRGICESSRFVNFRVWGKFHLARFSRGLRNFGMEEGGSNEARYEETKNDIPREFRLNNF